MRRIYFLVILMSISLTTKAQVGINTIAPDPSSILHIESNDRGVLFPRLTMTQMNAITENAKTNGKTVPGGLTIYCIDCCSNQPKGAMFYYNSLEWKSLDSDCSTTGDFPCVNITTNHIAENHFETSSVPFLFDGLLTEPTQDTVVDMKNLRLHQDNKDVIEFKLDNAIPIGGQVVFYWSTDDDPTEDLGLLIDFDNGGTTSQTSIDTFAGSLSNSTNVSNGNNDYILTITIVAETDTITVKSREDDTGKDPYLLELLILDDQGANIISPCN